MFNQYKQIATASADGPGPRGAERARLPSVSRKDRLLDAFKGADKRGKLDDALRRKGRGSKKVRFSESQLEIVPSTAGFVGNLRRTQYRRCETGPNRRLRSGHQARLSQQSLRGRPEHGQRLSSKYREARKDLGERRHAIPTLRQGSARILAVATRHAIFGDPANPQLPPRLIRQQPILRPAVSDQIRAFTMGIHATFSEVQPKVGLSTRSRTRDHLFCTTQTTPKLCSNICFKSVRPKRMSRTLVPGPLMRDGSRRPRREKTGASISRQRLRPRTARLWT